VKEQVVNRNISVTIDKEINSSISTRYIERRCRKYEDYYLNSKD
jgi:hypothetical protein